MVDLVTPLRDAAYLAFEDGTNDYTTAPKAAYVLEAQAARIAELEAALANARRDGMEAAAKWHDEQAAKAQQLSDMKVSAEDEEVWGDYAENHREYAAEIRAALEGGKDE